MADYQNNIIHYLEERVRINPDKLVFKYPATLSYIDFLEQVKQLAGGLHASGIRKGMKVILLTNANIGFYILAFSLFKIGAVLVLIDPGVGIPVMKRTLAGVQADAFIGSTKGQLFKLIAGRSLSKIRFNVSTGKVAFPKCKTLKHINSLSIHLEDSAKVLPDDIGGIFFTSGSTGPPKGVVYQNKMFHAQINLFQQHYHWNPKEIDCCTFPLIGLFSICLGCTLVLADVDPLKPAKTNPAKLWKQIIENECTHMFASPMLISKLAEQGVQNQIGEVKLKRIVTAGAPSNPEILNQFSSLVAHDAQIHTPYGATEALPVTDIDLDQIRKSIQQPIHESGICVGRTIPGVNLKIIEISDIELATLDDIRELEPGQVGEIIVSGPQVTTQYLKENDNKFAKVEGPKGRIYHRMGDLGRLDKNGMVWFYGRKNHRVQTEKTTLFTIPVEYYFNRIPGVKRTALVGIQNTASTFETPVIIIEPENSVSKREESILIEHAIELAQTDQHTIDIKDFLIHRNFPMDPRHNAKIFREKLALWATKRISKY